jgi:hypothetical protein
MEATMPLIVRRIFFVLAAALVTTPASAFTSASSQIIQIPGVTLATRGNTSLAGEDNQGTFTNGTGKYYAPLPAMAQGQRVCSFTLVYRDNDGDFGITARLMKKPIVVGASPFNPPFQMAAVATGGMAASATVAIKTDLTIRQPVLNSKTSFYYVEVDAPASTLEVLGIQIEVNSTCGPA